VEEKKREPEFSTLVESSVASTLVFPACLLGIFKQQSEEIKDSGAQLHFYVCVHLIWLFGCHGCCGCKQVTTFTAAFPATSTIVHFSVVDRRRKKPRIKCDGKEGRRP